MGRINRAMRRKAHKEIFKSKLTSQSCMKLQQNSMHVI